MITVKSGETWHFQGTYQKIRRRKWWKAANICLGNVSLIGLLTKPHSSKKLSISRKEANPTQQNCCCNNMNGLETTINKWFLTRVCVWKQIMLLVNNCYGYKALEIDVFRNVVCGKWWKVQSKVFLQLSLWLSELCDIYLKICVFKANKGNQIS